MNRPLTGKPQCFKVSRASCVMMTAGITLYLLPPQAPASDLLRSRHRDLRHKIVAAVERGMPKTQAARLFDVSLSSVKRYARMARRGTRSQIETRQGSKGGREGQEA